jgi:hypothetical protein
MTRHFGGEHWREALTARGESPRKQALLDAYQVGLRGLQSVHTAAFSISSKNETARYSLILATHSTSGLKCFNPVKWGFDPVQGERVNEFRGDQQLDLFDNSPQLTPLCEQLLTLAGRACTFRQLADGAAQRGYLEKHLRTALSTLAGDGLAVREHPLESRTPWPDDSLIRFYAIPSAAEAA